MQRSRRVLVVGAVALMCARADAQQRTGRVVAEDTGTPLANVRIEADGSDKAGALRSDKDGRFVLPSAHGTPSAIRLSKAGFVTRSAAGENISEIRLARGAAISGHVRDDFGTPLPYVHITAERLVQRGGQTAFEEAASADTDDIGEYRVFGLSAGQYVVALSGVGVVMGPGGVLRPGVQQRSAVKYYPDAAAPDAAQRLAVTSGAELTGIDFSREAPTGPVAATPPTVRSAGAGIRGRVVRADGSPARRARIEAASADQLFSPVTGVADEDGIYQVGVPPGRYRVTATDVGFATALYLEHNRPALVSVGAGAVTEHIDILVPRDSAIAGRIIDEFGDPRDDVRVVLEQVRFERGRRRAGPAFGVSPVRPDDRGQFRLFRVHPGRYLLHAVPAASTELGVYAPGTTSIGDATPIEVAAGQDVVGLEIALPHLAGAHISGRVMTADGQPFSGAVHLLASRKSDAIAAAAPTKVIADAGRFEFDGLAPGEYVVQAATSRRSTSAEGDFGAAFVTVAGSARLEVVIRMTAGSRVHGILKFDGDPPPSGDIELSSAAVDSDYASLADNPVARADIHEDWTFDMSGLNGPRRLILSRAPADWMLARITANGIDVTDTAVPFGRDADSLSNVEVTLTRKLTELSGTIAIQENAPSVAGVVAFAAESSAWYPGSRRLGFGRPDSSGAFSISKLPPGRYDVAAFGEADLPDPAKGMDTLDLLRALQPRAMHVTIAPGQRQTITLPPPPR